MKSMIEHLNLLGLRDVLRNSNHILRLPIDDDDSENSEARDENGNPIEQSSLIDGNITQNYGSTKMVNQHNTMPSAQESSTSLSGDGKKKRKKKAKDKEMKSQDIPGYKGDLGLDEVVSFIENESTDNQSKKKKTKNGPSVTAVEKHTVQGAVFPQQQKTPPAVDVSQKKATASTTAAAAAAASTTNKEAKKKKNGKNNVSHTTVVKENAAEYNENKTLNCIKTKDKVLEEVEKTQQQQTSTASRLDSNHKNLSEVKLLRILAAERVEEDYPSTPVVQPHHEEEEFKVVKKRDKKKALCPGVLSGRNGGVFSSWAQHKAHSIDYDARSKARSFVGGNPPAQRSSTPPPQASVYSGGMSSSSSSSSYIDRPSSAGGHGTVRALSPSAFPSLTRQRRNSTGNAHTAAAVDTSDDEDSQSAKSESKAEVPSSVISYANIAAGKGKKVASDESCVAAAVAAPAVSSSSNESSAANVAGSSCDRERRYSDSGVISVDNFPVMNTKSVSTDNRTCSSSGNIHEVVSVPSRCHSHNALASMQHQQQQQISAKHKSSSEPPIPAIVLTTQPSKAAAAQAKKTAGTNNCKNPSSSVIFLDEQKYSKNNSAKLDISFYFDAALDTPNNDQFDQLQLACSLCPPKIPNGIILPGSQLNEAGLTFGGECDEELASSEKNTSAAAHQNTPSTQACNEEESIVDNAADQVAFPPLQKNSAPPLPAAAAQVATAQCPPSRENDPNYQTGKFELEKAVTFLFTEWESVSRLATNHPERVVCYGSASLYHASK